MNDIHAAPASIPPPLAPASPTPTPVYNMMDTLHRTGHFKHLIAAIKASGLASAFNAAGPHTVFAPNDQAFGKLANEVLADLFKPASKERLTAILRLHMLPRHVKAAASGEIAASFKSLQGEDLTMNTAQGLRVNHARIVERDVEASNGVIHVIDTVLLPAAR
jgi:uncharacterized surface protein with fasciclin (FAS1) repeats